MLHDVDLVLTRKSDILKWNVNAFCAPGSSMAYIYQKWSLHQTGKYILKFKVETRMEYSNLKFEEFNNYYFSITENYQLHFCAVFN